MNWLDAVLLVVLVGGFIYGMKLGLFGALLMAAGLICGWQMASHFADDLGNAMSWSPATDTVATVIWYIVIIAATVAAFAYVKRLAGSALSMMTAGLSGTADRIGGMVAGVVIGLLLVGASIMGLARLAYDFRVPDAGGVSRAMGLPPTLEVRDGLNGALAGSIVSRGFAGAVDNIPADAIGFAPDDFEVAVLILQRRIDSGQY